MKKSLVANGKKDIKPELEQTDYKKHKLGKLRDKLDQFIFEEKEKTMMNQSDIPDPDSLEDHPMLPIIEEIADQNELMNDSYRQYYSVRSFLGENQSVAGSNNPGDYFS